MIPVASHRSNLALPDIGCYSFGVISLVSVYAQTEASDLTVKDAFYATLESVVDQCPRRDTLLVLGDFNASTGTERDGYEMCVGPHGSGICSLSM